MKKLILAAALGLLSVPALQAQEAPKKAFDANALPAVAAKVVRPRAGVGNVLAKLQAGQPVTIAYFGGSITAGAGASNAEKTSYRALMTQWFRNTFPQSTITEVNAAIGGTGSDLGAFRNSYDVLRFKPDLVFVEYAVNDAGAGSEQIVLGMEGIVRQIWRANPLTDVLFVYTYTVSQQADLDKGVFHRAASVHEAVAEHYDIPSISVAVPIAQLIREGKMLGQPAKDAQGQEVPVAPGTLLFSNDGVHPLDAAMAIYAQTIQAAGREIADASRPGPHQLKAPLLEGNWENAKLVPVEASMFSPGWKKLDAATGLGKTFGNRMPEIWEATQPGEKMRFSFKGTSVKLYDLLGPDGAQVWVTVDGQKRDKPVARFDSYSSYHRLATLPIADNLPDAVHIVEIEIDVQQPDRSSVTNREKEKPGFDPKKYDGTAVRIGGLLLIGDLVP
ncbi:MAG: hypothetical protein JWN98_2161 [Abditibacteriota bacterium]|nr:hypothetical protein [Abditibacteriota bacterium]